MLSYSQLARYGLFDARVPRYTSYPTVPHFGTMVGEAAFSEWIESIPAGSAISLYLHVPFCRRLCWFCACRTQGTQSIDPVIAYVQTLKQELALLGQRLAPAITLARLHWGGGTPTMIPPDLIRDLADAIFSLAPLSPGGEFS
ncbi:MAG: coproporphyrinogen III oxidase, partial [Rhodobacter sp.]|nr:coproporphyrinogen III oxidase [Rhodobacter sp.]